MEKKKKKWYQTGEFEDGYQFGDVFRTVKNNISEKKIKKLDKSAKTSVEEKKQKDGYFQKGALEDGFNLENIVKTQKGTNNDIKTDVGTGFLGVFEKLWDGVIMIATANNRTSMMEAANNAVIFSALNGGNPDKVFDEYVKMQDDVEKQAATMVEKDLYDERKITNKIIATSNTPSRIIKNGDLSIKGVKKAYKDELSYIEKDMEDDSIFAQKSDRLAETTGQYLAQAALTTTGVPWWVTAGASAIGGETENALKEGATFNEAGLSGVVAAGGEIISELLFGGPFTKTGLDDVLLNKFSKACANKLVNGFLKFTTKSSGEGLEELPSELFSRFGQWITYKGEKPFKEMFFSEEAMEQYVDTFVGGLFLGGLGQGYEVVKSNVSGVDYVTGLTENEQKVFDKKFENSINDAKTENGGKELTSKEKRAIYDNVIDEIKRGQVDTQIIEDALGGEHYSAYKNSLGNYNVLQEKLSELQSIDNIVKTHKQATKEVEIKHRLERIKTQAEKLRSILENKVIEKIDVDNIGLKDRESYLWNNYKKVLPKQNNTILNDAMTIKKISEDAFFSGLWEDAENTHKNNVEKDQQKSVENTKENAIMEETVDNDAGVPGEYTNEIEWSIYKHILVRKFGKGFFGKRVKQRNLRVDNYELKINPNNESYYLQHPDGKYVQFENMVDNILQDGKYVLNKKRSFYHVYDRGCIAQNRVLKQANRQIETANSVGYLVEWLVSDEKAVEQISRLFKENNINVSVKFYQE